MTLSLVTRAHLPGGSWLLGSSHLPWLGPGAQWALLCRCGHPRRPGPTCPAPSGLIRAAPASPSPAQTAPASAARNRRENACLCQLCRKQNSLWFVTQIFCLFFFFFQNITKLKTTPPTPTPQADRNDLFTLALAPGRALRAGRPCRRGAEPGQGGHLQAGVLVAGGMLGAEGAPPSS